MDLAYLIFIVLLVKAISGNEILQQIFQVKHEMLSDITYYQSCATTGEYVYAAFEKDSNSYYQKLTDIESIVVNSVSLITETRNVSIGLFDAALNKTKRLKEEAFEKIRLYFANLYSQGVADQNQLTAIKTNVSATDENSLHCDQTSREYESCLNGILTSLLLSKAELTTFGKNVCSTFNSPSSNGFDYAQTVFSNNTAAAKQVINSMLNQYEITQAEIMVSFKSKTRLCYNHSVSGYYRHSQTYEAKLKRDMYRKLNTLKIMIAAVKAGAAGTDNNVTGSALNTLKTRIIDVYISQYNFITASLNAIATFDFLGQLSEERDKVSSVNMKAQCATASSALTEFFICLHGMYSSFVSASDSIYTQYVALVYLDFPKDAPWWRIMYTVPPYINKALLYIPINCKIEQGLKCFRDYNIIYKTAEEIEIQYNSCSSYFYVVQ